MSAIGGPNIVDDSLAFYYDVDNVKSYRGEPTTNIVTNPTFLGTPNTQTSAIADNWYFSGDTSATGFRFYDSATSPIPLKFPDEGAVITTGPNVTTNRRIYYNGTVEPNTTYTLSYWFYSSNYGAVSNYFFTYRADGTVTTSPSYGQGFTTGKWVFIQQSFTTPADTGNTRNVNWGPVISAGTDSLFAMQRFQIEAKSHATPFINGTRSNTEGLRDLLGATSINLAGAAYDSSANIAFDGTNTYIEAGYLRDIVGETPEGISFELVIKADDLTTYSGMMGDYIGPSGTGFAIKRASLGDNRFEFRTYAANAIPRASTSITVGQYYHVVCTWKNTGVIQIFINGTLETTDSAAGTVWNHGLGVLRIGDCYNSMGNPAEFNGEIPLVKIYSKALNTSEVTSNFNAIKGRFNL